MKVCFISEEYPPYLLGGGGVYAYELTRAISRLNVEVHVLAPHYQTKTERKDNLSIHWQRTIFRPFLRLPSFLYSVKKNIGKIIQDYHIELIHSNEYAGFHVANKLPIVATIHSLLKDNLKNTNFLQRLKIRPYFVMYHEILRKSRKLISVSHLIRDSLITKNPDLKNKIIIVNEGIDTCKFNKINDVNIRKDYGIEKGDLLIFHPGGAVSKGKGALYLLDGLKKLKRKYDFKCMLTGNSREIWWKRTLSKKIKQKELEKEIILTGNIEYNDMPKYYSSSDIVVFPSLFEGYGLPPLEAMACEKPVIATKTGEIPYFIKNMWNGILIEIKDTEALYKNIKLLIENDDLRMKLAKNGRNFIEKKFSWSVVGKKVMQIYTSLSDEDLKSNQSDIQGRREKTSEKVCKEYI